MLYALSLVLPAIVVIEQPLLWGAPHKETLFGWQCLALGWLTVPWYANILLGFAAIGLAYRSHHVAAGFSFAAIVLALTARLYVGSEIRTLHVGYFVWLASMVAVLAASCAGLVRPPPPPPGDALQR